MSHFLFISSSLNRYSSHLTWSDTLIFTVTITKLSDFCANWPLVSPRLIRSGDGCYDFDNISYIIKSETWRRYWQWFQGPMKQIDWTCHSRTKHSIHSAYTHCELLPFGHLMFCLFFPEGAGIEGRDSWEENAFIQENDVQPPESNGIHQGKVSQCHWGNQIKKTDVGHTHTWPSLLVLVHMSPHVITCLSSSKFLRTHSTTEQLWWLSRRRTVTSVIHHVHVSCSCMSNRTGCQRQLDKPDSVGQTCLGRYRWPSVSVLIEHTLSCGTTKRRGTVPFSTAHLVSPLPGGRAGWPICQTKWHGLTGAPVTAFDNGNTRT